MAKPLEVIRGGNNVSVALWENQIQVKGKKVTSIKATLQRRYLDKNRKWQTTNSFGKTDLPDAAYCIHKAFERMIELQSKQANGNSNNEEVVVM
jgi:hypothetical protein